MTSIVETLNSTQIAQAQSQAAAIASAVTSAVNPGSGQFVFFAAFDGTNNGDDPALDGSNDDQTTAVNQLEKQIIQSANVKAGYYAGVGTPGTEFGSSFLSSAVTAQSITTAQNAYNDFANAAYAWWNSGNQGGSITSVITSFSRGGGAASIFSQMLYENGLVYTNPSTNTQTVLIPPGTVGSVAAALIIDPVLTGVNGNMDFPPNVQNLTIVRAQNEYRTKYEAPSYTGDNASIYPVIGDHGDAGDLYGNELNGVYQGDTSGLGGIYLQGYTQFLSNAGLPIAVVPPSRAYVSPTVTPAVVHSEVTLGYPFYDYSLYNPSNDLTITRKTTSAGNPVSVIGSATLFTAYNDDIIIGGNGYKSTINSSKIVFLPNDNSYISGIDDNLKLYSKVSLIYDDNIIYGSAYYVDLYQYDKLSIVYPQAFRSVVRGFTVSDTIDLESIGTTTSATLGANNLLTVQGSGGDASLQLDPSQNYANDSFVFSSDGNGGTNIAAVPDSQNVTLPSGNALLLVNDPANFTGTISGFVPGDTIDLAGIGTATSAILGDGNVVTVQNADGSTFTLNLDPSADYTGENTLVSSDGNGGTDITVAPNVPPVTTVPGPQTVTAGIPVALAEISVSDFDALSADKTFTVNLADSSGFLSALVEDGGEVSDLRDDLSDPIWRPHRRG